MHLIVHEQLEASSPLSNSPLKQSLEDNPMLHHQPQGRQINGEYIFRGKGQFRLGGVDAMLLDFLGLQE